MLPLQPHTSTSWCLIINVPQSPQLLLQVSGRSKTPKPVFLPSCTKQQMCNKNKGEHEQVLNGDGKYLGQYMRICSTLPVLNDQPQAEKGSCPSDCPGTSSHLPKISCRHHPEMSWHFLWSLFFGIDWWSLMLMQMNNYSDLDVIALPTLVSISHSKWSQSKQSWTVWSCIVGGMWCMSYLHCRILQVPLKTLTGTANLQPNSQSHQQCRWILIRYQLTLDPFLNTWVPVSLSWHGLVLPLYLSFCLSKRALQTHQTWTDLTMHP